MYIRRNNIQRNFDTVYKTYFFKNDGRSSWLKWGSWSSTKEEMISRFFLDQMILI